LKFKNRFGYFQYLEKLLMLFSTHYFIFFLKITTLSAITTWLQTLHRTLKTPSINLAPN
jgi:hypothetical protein